MKRTAAAFLVSLAIVLGNCGEPPAETPEVRAADLPPAEVAGEIESERVSPDDMTADWPALAAAADGSVWLAYVEWNGSDADAVVVRRRSPEGTWGGPIVLDDGNWDHYLPAIVAVPGGAMAFWSGRDDGAFQLYGASVSDYSEVGGIETIAASAHSDFHVRAAASPDGDVTVTWQSFRDLQSDVYARRRTVSGWGPEVRVSPSDASDWEPSVALDSTGRAWISWDSYHAGNYDVFLASFDGQSAGEPIAITSDPRAEFHSSVTVDAADRAWIAFDTARKNWGKDYSESSAAEGSEGLHARRGLGCGCSPMAASSSRCRRLSTS